MKIVCFILILMLMTTRVLASGSILWSSKHSTTELIKDEEWLVDALLAEETIDEVLEVDPSAEDIGEPVEEELITEPLESIMPPVYPEEFETSETSETSETPETPEVEVFQTLQEEQNDA